MATALELTPKEIAIYQDAARDRWEQEQEELVQRERRAWELARQAATLLRGQFKVTRVMVFGSLAHKGCFTPWSDVDIAAWGIGAKDTFRAIGAVMDIDSKIEVNLVDVNTCSSSLLATIEQEGVNL